MAVKENHYIRFNVARGTDDTWQELEPFFGTRTEAEQHARIKCAEFYTAPGENIQSTIETLFDNENTDQICFADGRPGGYVAIVIDSDSDIKARVENEKRMAEASKARDAKMAAWLKNRPAPKAAPADGWKDWYDKNSDGYGQAIMVTAWYVMDRIDNGGSDVENLINEADAYFNMGLTGFQGSAIRQIVKMHYPEA